jgi:hypothetical protein
LETLTLPPETLTAPSLKIPVAQPFTERAPALQVKRFDARAIPSMELIATFAFEPFKMNALSHEMPPLHELTLMAPPVTWAAASLL